MRQQLYGDLSGGTSRLGFSDLDLAPPVYLGVVQIC